MAVQLWLNENQLVSLPRALPPTLRRLLVDSNHVESVEADDAFPRRSQLTTLSLAGNQVHRVSATVLRRLTNLQSLDLSNNQLRRLDAGTFSGNAHLRSLTLAKNPLDALQTGAFSGLRALRALTLSYVPTVDIQLDAAALLRPLTRLSRLDVDNSPGIARALLWTPADDRPSPVEELGLVNCDLTTLPADFPRRFPRLAALRLSSARWHCDRAMMWLRDWLLEPAVDVRVQSLSDIRCATPRALRHRPLVSLNDDEFVATTWKPPPQPTSTATTTTTTTTTATTTTTVKKRRPEMRASSTQLGRKSTLSPLYLVDDYLDPEMLERRPSSPRTSTDVDAIDARSTLWSVASTTSSRHRAGHHGHHGRRAAAADELLGTFKARLIVAAVTIGATLVIAAVIVAAIVSLWRHSRRSSPAAGKPSTPPSPASVYDDDTLSGGGGGTTPRTFIKYKNKNGVLLFSTPVADSPSSLTTAANDAAATPDSCLIGETDADGAGSIRYVLSPPSSATSYKTRVYRWEDF